MTKELNVNALRGKVIDAVVNAFNASFTHVSYEYPILIVDGTNNNEARLYTDGIDDSILFTLDVSDIIGRQGKTKKIVEAIIGKPITLELPKNLTAAVLTATPSEENECEWAVRFSTKVHNASYSGTISNT